MRTELISANVHVSNDIEAGIKIEADVTINNGAVSDIYNARVLQVDETEMEVPVAEFYDNSGSRNVTYYGHPTLEQQVELLTVVAEFCTDIRAKDFTITTE